jgi:hypothetical protein
VITVPGAGPLAPKASCAVLGACKEQIAGWFSHQTCLYRLHKQQALRGMDGDAR